MITRQIYKKRPRFHNVGAKKIHIVKLKKSNEMMKLTDIQ